MKEVSPPQKEVQSSLYTSNRRNIKTLVKRRKYIIRRVIPFPSVLEAIPKEDEEEDDEDEEDNLLLNWRTHLARATELKWRRSSAITLPSIPKKPIQSTNSKDEMQQWINE